jgi:Fe-S-cluster containining protein
VKIDDAWPGCERFEAALDCQTCGACCRAAYHSVEVSRRDPVVKKHPTYVVDRTTYLEIVRSGDRCGALTGGEVDAAGRSTRYACVIYDDRPKTCRDFTLGSEHCLTARRRVGLSL